MKLSSWTAATLATPAIATGICLLSAGTAQAAPDDANGSSASSSTDTSSSADDSDSPSSHRAAKVRNATARSGTGGHSESDADTDLPDADDDGARATNSQTGNKPRSGSHLVPPSVRTSDSDSLVTIDTLAPDEDAVDTEDEVGRDGADVNDDLQDPSDDTATVQLAINQLDDAREQLRAATWGDGNFLAGLAAILPQMFLGGAQTNLDRWMDNHARLQQEFVDTLNNPFANAIVRMRLENSINRTMRTQDQMDAAEKLVTVVGWFGPTEAAAAIADLIDEASDNGLVYEVLKLDMQYNNQRVRTEPVIYVSVNGGEPVPLLLDSGSLGLVIDPRDVGYEGLGQPGNQDYVQYGTSDPMYYHEYFTTITLNGHIRSAQTTVNIIDLESVYDFTEYNGDYVGILGIGQTRGPGPVNPLSALPGLLGRGLTLDERRRRVILGPNPYAARVTLSTSPDAPLKVKVGDYDTVEVAGLVDSGGILGNIPNYAINGSENVPVGTLISVYTEEDEFLYSYRTTKANSPSFTEGDDFNTGYLPFSQTSIYIDFSGAGKTVFNYR